MKTVIKDRIEKIRKGEVPEGYKQTKIGIIPDDWEVNLVDNVAKRGTGHTPNKNFNSYYGGNIKWISLQDSDKLDNGFIYNTCVKISSEGLNNSSANLLQAGTVLISRDAGVGKSAIMAEDMAVSQHFVTWTCTNRLNNWFLFYLLQKNKPEFERIAVGSTIKTIGMGFFEKYKIQLPSIPEQNKIAEILFTWDKAIDLKEKLIQQKKELKRGLMQKLLTGEVRFPEFDYEWNTVSISNILKESCIIADEPNLKQQISVRLHLNGVFLRKLNGNEIEGATTLYIRKAGQFIYGKQNFHNGAFGIIPQELNNYQTSSDIPTFSFKDGIDSRFFLYYWSREVFYKRLESYTTGTGSKRLSPKTFLKMKMSIPTIFEQRRITNFLDIITNEIKLMETELQYIKQQKKGLMQLLLTGIVRVNTGENNESSDK